MKDAAEAGLKAWVEDGKLHVRGPKSAEAIGLEILSRKAEVVEYLTSTMCPNCRKPVDQQRRCWKCCDRPCRRCGDQTGSAFLSLCNRCGMLEG